MQLKANFKSEAVRKHTFRGRDFYFFNKNGYSY